MVDRGPLGHLTWNDLQQFYFSCHCLRHVFLSKIKLSSFFLSGTVCYTSDFRISLKRIPLSPCWFCVSSLGLTSPPKIQCSPLTTHQYMCVVPLSVRCCKPELILLQRKGVGGLQGVYFNPLYTSLQVRHLVTAIACVVSGQCGG